METKSQMINRNAELSQENAELKAENERLNRCMMEALHHEGDSLRKTIKYKQTLQEIKAIAETARQSIELQARFISTLITKVEEEWK